MVLSWGYGQPGLGLGRIGQGPSDLDSHLQHKGFREISIVKQYQKNLDSHLQPKHSINRKNKTINNLWFFNSTCWKPLAINWLTNVS